MAFLVARAKKERWNSDQNLTYCFRSLDGWPIWRWCRSLWLLLLHLFVRLPCSQIHRDRLQEMRCWTPVRGWPATPLSFLNIFQACWEVFIPLISLSDMHFLLRRIQSLRDATGAFWHLNFSFLTFWDGGSEQCSHLNLPDCKYGLGCYRWTATPFFLQWLKTLFCRKNKEHFEQCNDHDSNFQEWLISNRRASAWSSVEVADGYLEKMKYEIYLFSFFIFFFWIRKNVIWTKWSIDNFIITTAAVGKSQIGWWTLAWKATFCSKSFFVASRRRVTRVPKKKV